MPRFPRFARIPTLIALAVLACSSLSFAQNVVRTCSGLSPGSTRAQVSTGIVGGNGCTPGNIILDGSFEAATGIPLDSPNWTEASTNFGSPLCDAASCGTGGGTALPRTGTIWSWFGGIAGPETASLSQAVTFPTGATSVTLNFYLWIGAVAAPFTDTLVVQVDGVTQTTFTEPATAEVGYTLRSVDLTAFANGLSHTINFLYASPVSGGVGNFSVDDVTLDVVCPAGALVTPTALAVDSAGNGVLEPNEPLPVAVAPTWRNDGLAIINLTGTSSNFTGPAGPTYLNPDSTADYGAIGIGASAQCTDCYSVQIAAATRPVQHWDSTIDENVVATLPSGTPSKTWTLHVGDSFTDVLATDQYYPSIETIFHLGVTVGCGGTFFCPLQNNKRQEMAPFLLKADQGAGYSPPACTGIFTDVPCPATPTFPYSDFIEDLWTRGITAGCAADPGPPPTMQYCPDRDISRAEMAVFLIKTSQPPGYIPPACTGIFTDVPCPATPTFPYSDFIEDIFLRNITAGCASQPGPPPTMQYCPDNPATRQEMAVFLRLMFGLVLYGP